MSMTAEQTRDFLKFDLGPELDKNGYGSDSLKVQILDYVLQYLPYWTNTIFSDNDASKYAAGIAIHWYGPYQNRRDLLDTAHQNFPDKFILATEACCEKQVLGDWSLAEKYATDILRVYFVRYLSLI